jgi:uncharacterized membrane protein YidH (DUF202 family)
VLAVCLVLLGTAVSATAWSRWVRTQRAMRIGRRCRRRGWRRCSPSASPAIALVTVVLLVVTEA